MGEGVFIGENKNNSNFEAFATDIIGQVQAKFEIVPEIQVEKIRTYEAIRKKKKKDERI